MSVYLIDYENVNFSGLEGIGDLTRDDDVVIFYSDTASTIPMNLHIDVQRCGARMKYIRIEKTAKNYLDFQLAAISGYLVGTTEQTDFIVISRDTGFDSVLDLWNTQDFVGRELHFSRQDSVGGPIPIKRTRRKRTSKTSSKTSGSAARKTSSKSSGSAAKKTSAKSADTAAKKSSSRKPDISSSDRAAIKAAVKDFELKPTDYTKIYRTFAAESDKHSYDIALIKTLKDQELGNKVYKATLQVFSKKHGN